MSDPAVTVLHGGDPPPADALGAAPGTVRHVSDVDGLVAALPHTEVLLVWDFLSDAVADAWRATDTSGVRWVHTASAGVDRLIFPGLVTAGIPVTNARGVFDTPIAEYVLALVLAQAKDLPATLAAQQRGEWHHRETERVAGRRAVVVGGGGIGTTIARYLRAVDMTVEQIGRREFGDLHRVLPGTDWLVLAAPLTDTTRGMLDAATIGQLPPHARVVNVGRGALVVEDDLIAALRAGRIAGAALDVVAAEPLTADSPLWRLPGVLVSPHMSGDVVGWQAELAAGFAANLARYRAGEPLHNVVDMDLGYVRSGGPR